MPCDMGGDDAGWAESVGYDARREATKALNKANATADELTKLSSRFDAVDEALRKLRTQGNEATRVLCGVCQAFDDSGFLWDAIEYVDDPLAGILKDWWEEHKRLDAREGRR